MVFLFPVLIFRAVFQQWQQAQAHADTLHTEFTGCGLNDLTILTCCCQEHWPIPGAGQAEGGQVDKHHSAMGSHFGKEDQQGVSTCETGRPCMLCMLAHSLTRIPE